MLAVCHPESVILGSICDDSYTGSSLSTHACHRAALPVVISPLQCLVESGRGGRCGVGICIGCSAMIFTDLVWAALFCNSCHLEYLAATRALAAPGVVEGSGGYGSPVLGHRNVLGLG